MNFREFLKNNTVILDGGMGTLLQNAGLEPGEAPERWNITHADTVTGVHRAYFDAGSNVVNTNTFGANTLHFGTAELYAIVSAAVKNAKAARDISSSKKEKFISLDIGPTGRLLKPYGDLDFEDAVKIFAETVKTGVSAGVDLVTVETMNDSLETKAALLAVKENSDLPVIVTNAYSADGTLMTGASPEAMTSMLEGMGADAIGINCSLGPAQLMPTLKKILVHASVPVVFKPNAGLPKVIDGKTVFDITADEFAQTVKEAVENGVRVVGGCCGTTPEYIKKLCAAISDIPVAKINNKNETVISSYTHAVSFADAPLLIGERINPTGKKRFRQAIQEHDISYILKEGIAQQERGVHALDVNVGVPGIDEAQVLTEAVEELQAVIDLPLQIDTASPEAMACALRRYNGKALINSVNGKQESMDAIFPLVKKYGGVIIALTLDENGIPATADGRVEIAKKILNTAAKYGIAKKDIVFDTLTMTVSADKNAALITLDALNRIRTELGCHTLLGVSNVSFGLPSRDTVNGVFFALALEKGLSAAIMNPYSTEMMKTYYAYRALNALDANCNEYIAFGQTLADDLARPAVEIKHDASVDEIPTLQNAIRKGLREQARDITASLLNDTDALRIINAEIIPALDDVGKGFENKTVYLPQLLMSAEAAQSAFEVIKASAVSSVKDDATKIVLATVRGDIHDIGKNIVRLLLENYGFDVYDLGKDVPPDKIVDEILHLHAPIAGLSALMTTTVPAMEETVRLIHEKAPFCHIIVGGAVLDPDYAKAINADFYACDAMETVRIAESLCKK